MKSYLCNNNGTLSIIRSTHAPSGALTKLQGDWYADQVQYFTPYRYYYDALAGEEVRLNEGENPPAEITHTNPHTGLESTYNPREAWGADFDQAQYDIDIAAAAQARTDAQNARASYLYAYKRSGAYVEAFSEDPNPNAIDAIGHILDAVIKAILDNDTTELTAIKTQIDAIKAANPKP